MGSINLDNTGSGGAITLSSDGTSLLLDGSAVGGGGGTEFIASVDASNSASVSFTGFDASKYDSYVFVLSSIVPSENNGFLGCRFSVDGGSNYLSASDSYKGNSNENHISLFGGGVSNTASNGGINAVVGLNRPDLNNKTALIMYSVAAVNGNGDVKNVADNGQSSGKGITNATTVVNGIQFLFTSGNITSGTITMYGLKNA